jgi:N12 class adenine-specific DNA methylase/predicted RNA methylase
MPTEQAVLARWSGWGAIPDIFDPDSTAHRAARDELTGLLSEAEWAAARRSTINAHYTSARVVTLMWSTVHRLGFQPDGARVLEPGCGSGNFIGFAPPGVQVIGVELDPTTAAIAQALYPAARIRAESFADTNLSDASQDLVIGNVPFGAIALHDRHHNPHRHSLHNHFIVKSLDLVRPGGLVAVVSSRFTLDSADAAARADMAARADLIGAVRLPAATFRAAAGTDVVADVLIFRRRSPEQPPSGADFQSLTTVDTPDRPTQINEYYAAHPHMVAGRLRVENGQYNADDLTVVADPARPIEHAFARLAESGTNHHLTYVPPAPAPRPAVTPRAAPDDDPSHLGGRARKEGSIIATGPSSFARVVASRLEPFSPPKTALPELRALTALRDTLAELLDSQARVGGENEFAAVQARLNTLYDRYVARFGPLSRYQVARTGRVHPETGADVLRRIHPSMGGFRRDPDFPALLALEHFDDETAIAAKAAIFSRRVVGARAAAHQAGTPAEALAISLDETGRVDLACIGQLLSLEPEPARAALASLVYDDPHSGTLQTTQHYLSGNVRQKLVQARAAAETDPRYETNVAALTAVQPDDLTPAEIDARPGATWIPPADIKAFLADTFEGLDAVVEHTPITASWAVQVPTWKRTSLLITSTWGTKRADAITLFDKSLNQQQHQVYDTDPDGHRIFNPEDTLLAQEKQQALSDRFAAWIWESPERRDRLAARYNQLFNSIVLPAWDGSHQTFPGLSPAFRPHRHQIDAVWRAVQEPSVLLGHAVGAGKTATMVMSVMEMRRLGLVRKPALVVPNHMLDQVTRDFLHLYPQADVLMATGEETRPDRRKQFVARCATGDWDAIVITHSAFEKIPVSTDTEAAYLDQEIAQFRSAITTSRQGDGLSVKQLETAVLKKEERLKALRDNPRRDDGITFEASGIDQLCVDLCRWRDYADSRGAVSLKAL